tara:strand:- start:255 stop:476 length:222 start_codon:yes stop_codon:yes gene_type:complete
MSIYLKENLNYIFFMNKRDLIFLNQMIRKLASPYFVENDVYEYDRLQWATGVTREDLFKAVKLIEKEYKNNEK